VRNLSLTVRRGEILGFLGPNGAGKSTSIKMLLGLVQPTGGQAFVLGVPSSDVEVRSKIGFLPEDFSFYEWLTPTELLRLHGRLSGVPSATLRDRVPALIDLVGLAPHRDKRLQNFSKGMLQRIGLAQALIHEPELIFLDEPTSGLDPMGRRLVRDIIRAQRERGATVFLNSHLLSEIEITCDQAVFIREGEVVTSRDLRAVPQDEVRVVVRARKLTPQAVAGLTPWCAVPPGDPKDLANAPDLADANDVANADGANNENISDNNDQQLTLIARSTDALPHILRHLVASGADIYQFTPQRLSLEDLFVSVMGEDRGL
jgi:ABC-2 type transport system ATP-binding protein